VTVFSLCVGVGVDNSLMTIYSLRFKVSGTK
jgi:hypothetical protein